MKITSFEKIKIQLIISLVLTVLYVILAYNTIDDLILSIIANFLFFFIISVIFTTLSIKKLLFIILVSILSALVYLSSYDPGSLVYLVLFTTSMKFVALYGIFVLVYTFIRTKETNIIVIIAAIIYFLMMMMLYEVSM